VTKGYSPRKWKETKKKWSWKRMGLGRLHKPGFVRKRKGKGRGHAPTVFWESLLAEKKGEAVRGEYWGRLKPLQTKAARRLLSGSSIPPRTGRGKNEEVGEKRKQEDVARVSLEGRCKSGLGVIMTQVFRKKQPRDLHFREGVEGAQGSLSWGAISKKKRERDPQNHLPSLHPITHSNTQKDRQQRRTKGRLGKGLEFMKSKSHLSPLKDRDHHPRTNLPVKRSNISIGLAFEGGSRGDKVRKQEGLRLEY